MKGVLIMRTRRNLGTKVIKTANSPFSMEETFNVIQGNHTLEGILNRNTTWERTFYQLYQNPSEAKKSIYAYWERFFSSLGIWDIVCQGSSMTFSITAYDHKNGNIYYITKCYNRLFIPKVA